MRRSLSFRFAALLVAGLVGMSAPGVALAHGYAHHEKSELAGEAGDHHHGPAQSATALANGQPTAVVHDPSESRDHDHPQLSQPRTVRVDAPLFVLPAVPASLPSSVTLVGTVSLLVTAAPARAGPRDTPPRQPRPPPLG